MPKYEDVVVEWVLGMCNLGWEQGEAPEDLRKAIVVLMYRRKAIRGDLIVKVKQTYSVWQCRGGQTATEQV